MEFFCHLSVRVFGVPSLGYRGYYLPVAVCICLSICQEVVFVAVAVSMVLSGGCGVADFEGLYLRALYINQILLSFQYLGASIYIILQSYGKMSSG